MSSRMPGPPPDLPGFRFVELLGTGGFADVFQYEQLGLGRKVAVKVLLSDIDADIQASFEVESSVMAKLSNHPSIVSIYQAGVTADGRPFLVMEHCPPPHLALRIRARPLTVTKALEVAIQLSGAVETAHRLGILHRDIKPANILFTEFGRAALTDFGISVTTAGAQSGEGFGMSVPWAPPEQLTVGAPMGPSGDVYALAATLYTALVGRAPFNVPGGANDGVAMAARVRTMPLPPTRRPDVPESLERTLRAAMAKAPHERYATALDFARGLQGIQAELHVPVTTIDVLDEHVIDVGAPDEGGGTRMSGFVSIDPEPIAPAVARTPLPPPPASRTAGAWTFSEPDHVTNPAAPAPVAARGPAPAPFDLVVPEEPTVHKPAATPVPDAVAPAATKDPAGGRSPASLVVGALLLVVLGAAIWFATTHGGPKDDGSEARGPSAVDPIGDDEVAAPTGVKVSRVGDGLLAVSWRASDEQAGDRYFVQVISDRPGHIDVVGSQYVTGTTATVKANGGNCVRVMTDRKPEASGWSEPGCVR